MPTAAGQSDIADGQLVDHGAVYAGRQLAGRDRRRRARRPIWRDKCQRLAIDAQAVLGGQAQIGFRIRGASQMAVQIGPLGQALDKLSQQRDLLAVGLQPSVDLRTGGTIIQRHGGQGRQEQQHSGQGGCQGIFHVWIC